MSTDQSIVTYKDIPGFPGYRAGDDGSVWSCWKREAIRGRRPRPGESCWVIGSEWRAVKSKLMKAKGRYNVELAGKTMVLHKAILLAFVGPCPEGMEGCHEDGNPLNNRLDNLRWDTKLSNARD